MPDSPALAVSVVVPVYNAGPYLERCAPSLLQQSLGADRYEVVYVDDGSTDDSLARLTLLAAAHPHVRVTTQPNSGWPGKPRNVGVAMARGEYVQFVDQDDELAPEALERMYAVASANRSDVVLGKMGGEMSAANPAFRRSVASGTLADVPAIETLTGHKMFRRAFLLEHDLRFPEGYWRMEDLLFVARVYARQPRLSVVADYTCYLWHARDDGGNNSVAAFDIPSHYERLRVIIATLRDGLPPGDLTDTLLARLYRIETLSRVRERYLFNPAKTDWYEAFEHLSAVARECFPLGVRGQLSPVDRMRGVLVEAGDRARTYELARRVDELVPVINRGRLAVDDRAVLRARLRFSLAHPDGAPLALVPDGPDRWRLDPRITADLAGAADLALDDPFQGARAELQLYDLDRAEWWYPEGELRPDLRPGPGQGTAAPSLVGDLEVDPATAAAGQPLKPGRYAVWLTGQLLGVDRRRRLVVPQRQRAEEPAWTVSGRGPVVVRADWSRGGARLHLEVADRQAWLADAVSGPDDDYVSEEPNLPVRVPGRLPTGAVPVELTLTSTAAPATTVGATASLQPTGAEGAARLELGNGVPDGRWTVRVSGAAAPLAQLEVRRGRVQGLAGPGHRAPTGILGRLRGALHRPRPSS